MKKQLNVDVIQSELRGGSAFFPGYTGSSKPASPPEKADRDGETRTPGTPVPPVRDVRVVPPVPLVPAKKRVMKQRHPFDIYRDQYEALQELALEERKQGGVGSMSAMVRQALDAFISSRKIKK